MPSRRKRIPNVYNLAVPVGIAAHSAGAYHLLAAFLQHLVFAREQCHASFQDLTAHAQACSQLQQQQQQLTGRVLRLKTSSRKALKYYDGLSAMLRLLCNIPLLQLHGQQVAVLLGSSALRPREVYCFSLPAGINQPGVAPPSEKQLAAGARQMLRALIMEHQTITEWDEAPGPTKMFLFFSAPEGALPCPPDGFTAKRGFYINLRKAFQVNISLGQQCYVDGDDRQLLRLSQQMCTSMHLSDHTGVPQAAAAAAPPVWYQCNIHVKGLKPAAS